MSEQQLDSFLVALYITAPRNIEYFELCFTAYEEGRFTEEQYLDSIMESFSHDYHC